MDYYRMEENQVLEQLDTGPAGLSSPEAGARLERYGKNLLQEGEKKTLAGRILEKILDPMILVLLGAAGLSALAGEPLDSVIILAVVILNALLGIFQEGKAERAIGELKKLTAPMCRVVREGIPRRMPAEDLVPGDIVMLETGDLVPADIRLILVAGLETMEAALTGESLPVGKVQCLLTVPEDLPPGDRKNMAYLGTSVVRGRGTGVVTATGMDTEIGRIAGILGETSGEKTPLQLKLARLSRVLSIGVLFICLFIFLLGILRNPGASGRVLLDQFLMAVSLAVAAIPEGLVAVVTIVLSLGVTRMSVRKAIIRRLTAVETLGCTQVICSDKTGTLTRNRMTVVETTGHIEQLALAMVLCNDAVESDEDFLGDPTETALARFALGNGQSKRELESRFARVGEIPFDGDRKRMTTFHEEAGGILQFTKGAPEVLLSRCTRVLLESGLEVDMSPRWKETILEENHRMASRALRVLGAARRLHEALPGDVCDPETEEGLTFIGLAGLADPVREEAREAISLCRGAGIRPVMITGDHRTTALAVARELELADPQDQVLTGNDLSSMTDGELENRVLTCNVYARVQPEHKVRIVRALKRQGYITAMTGDGVNDAPALKVADIGVGMGLTGTDVTRSVSDMVLADDNFATIVSAVEEGRRIYENLRKAVQYLLSSNLSEVLALLSATLMGFRLFSPVHILWINLVTDTFPAVALGLEEAEPDLMNRPPRDPGEGILAGGLGVSVLYQGGLMALLTLASWYSGSGVSPERATTMAFVTLSAAEVFHCLNLRSRRESVFREYGVNPWLPAAMAFSLGLTLGVLYLPGLADIFRLERLPAGSLVRSLGLALLVIPMVELVKLLIRRKP